MVPVFTTCGISSIIIFLAFGFHKLFYLCVQAWALRTGKASNLNKLNNCLGDWISQMSLHPCDFHLCVLLLVTSKVALVKRRNRSDNSWLVCNFNEKPVGRKRSPYQWLSINFSISHFSLAIIPVFKVGIVFIIFVQRWILLPLPPPCSFRPYRIIYKHFISVTENKWNSRLFNEMPWWNGWPQNLYLDDWLLFFCRRHDKCFMHINWKMMDLMIVP